MTKLSNKSGGWLIIFGFLLIIMGIIFQLQSISLIGPTSSFMYANQDWTFNGLIVIGVGTSVIVIGLYMKTRKVKNL
jgi:cbb3-type cytochrome oxidase subunit 1